MSVDALFRPFQVKSLKMPNRIVMAPMTRSFSPGGIPTSDVAGYYRRRAEGGVGLIVTEGTVVDRPAARNDANVPVFHGEALPQWKKVVEAVHAAGGLIAPQLWHVGSARGQGEDWQPLGKVDSPSGMTSPGKRRLEPMTDEDIADTIAAFGRSARATRELGFDAVEIHGAHGYLIDQFFWSGLNDRADKWGGGTFDDRALGDDQPDPALGPAAVVAGHVAGGDAARREGPRHRRHDDAVGHLQGLDLKGAEQGVDGHGRLELSDWNRQGGN